MTLTMDELRNKVQNGQISTVVVGSVDLHGRLIGKRLTARHFVEMAQKKDKMSMCYYFLAMTIEGHVAEGFEVARWENGFGNGLLQLDFGTLCRTPWMEKTALIMADMHDHRDLPFFCAPRTILRRQLQKLSEKSFRAKFASELEFHLFSESQKSAREKQWRNLGTAQPHHRCMHLVASSVDEPFMRRMREGFEAAGIQLEATHSEYGAGQQELNFEPAEPMTMADRHVLAKQTIHEMANQAGLAATFMAKYNKDEPGCGCHIHMSLEHIGTGETAFYDENGEHGMSKVMRQWVAGLLKYAAEYTFFLAPFINSYKRLQPNSWAPTKVCWTVDNRTSSFRLCGQSSSNVHIECRIGGADLNPYLAFAALIAAGIAGIEEGLELPKAVACNVYASADAIPELPKSLRIAAELMANSEMLKRALGENVLRHYKNSARIELEDFEKEVTDWELRRAFDRC